MGSPSSDALNRDRIKHDFQKQDPCFTFVIIYLLFLDHNYWEEVIESNNPQCEKATVKRGNFWKGGLSLWCSADNFKVEGE